MSPRAGIVAAAAVVVAVAAGIVLLGRAGDAPVTSPEEPRATPTARPTETLEEQVARVARVVADVRELEFVRLPELTLMTDAEVADRIQTELDAYTAEDAELEGRILELLGALPADTDLKELLTTALSEQVAGFYDPDTGELVVNAEDRGRRVGRIEEVTLAHELQHALADQVLGLPDLAGEDPMAGDALLAQQSLIEGDATLTMQRYTEVGFSTIDQLMLAAESAALADQLEAMTSLPHYIQESLLFPYQAGLGFVQAVHADGGWAAVDAVYADPPATTAQILFPDRYLAGEDTAVEVTPPPPLPGPWALARSASFGAADLHLLLRAPGGDPERAVGAAERVAGSWRGGRLDLFVDGDRSALATTFATSDLDRSCRATVTWLARADEDARTRPADGGSTVVTGPARDAVVTCADGEVRVGIAADVETAARLTLRP